jgi:hypothetical protein
MRFAVALCAAAALVAAPLHAQFRKPKINLPGVGSTQSNADRPAANRGGTAPAPEFNDRNLEITDARLDGVLKGLAAAKVIVDRRSDERLQEAYQRDRQAYDPKKDKWDACSHDAKNAFGLDLQTRLMAAQQKGDVKEMQRLADSIQKSMMGPNVAQQAEASTTKLIQAKCGSQPVAPVDPGRGDPQGAIRKEAGLTDEQWYLLRERLDVLAYQKKAALEKGLGGYTATESQAAAKRYDELQKLREYILSS